MNRFVWMTCALAAFLAAGCGSKTPPKVVGAEPSKTPTGAASAEEVAKEMRGGVSCPAKASTQQPAGTPVDDVTGVWPGMPLDVAANFVMCDNPLMVVTEDKSRNYNINTYNQPIRQGFDGQFAQPRVVKTSQQILNDMQNEAMQRGANTYVAPLQPGQSRYFVSTMGMPGQEVVLSVSREEYYATGKLPTVDSVEQALVAKYGTPSAVNGTYLWWEYDPSGNKITQDSPLSGTCRINVSPDAGTSLSTQCGVTVGALIQASSDNPGLAHSLAVNSQNGAAGFAILQNTANTLQQMDAAKKSQQLNDATKNSQKPTL